MFVVAQFKGKEGILLQSTKAIVRRDLTGRSTMRWGTYLKRYGTLYLLLLVPLAFFIIFRYVPMSYILLAFKKNNILKAPWLLDWAKNGGWEWFIKSFNDKNFIDALKNTIILNLLDLVIGTPMPILMALLLNELAFPKFKRVAQTVLYLPHFLSWVIISSLSLRLLATNDGLINQIFGTNIAFLGTENNWRATYIVLEHHYLPRRADRHQPGAVRSGGSGRHEPPAQNLAHHPAGHPLHHHHPADYEPWPHPRQRVRPSVHPEQPAG